MELNDNEDYSLDITIPDSYDDFPTVDKVKGHDIFTLSEIKQYFDKDLRRLDIRMINGEVLDEFGMCRQCDYCRFNEINGGYFKYCNECRMDMCNMCYEETSEEIALKNGAKNWKKRKDKLEECRGHDLVEKQMNRDAYCDDCKDTITSDSWWYDGKKHDVCQDCYENKKEDLLELKLFKNVPKDEQINFGSFCDWIPILKDEEENMILVNLNKSSKYYDWICFLSVDNHGRIGFFTEDEKLNIVLEKIREFKTELDKEYEGKDTCSWDYSYSLPIKKYMKSKNMEIHYG